MVLTKRTTKKSTGTPKKIEAPEPDTYTEKGATNTAEKTTPTLGRCTKCKVMPSHSESDHLCYDCHMLDKGFEYDAKTNLYILSKRRK
jgi:hypothetical protein